MSKSRSYIATVNGEWKCVDGIMFHSTRASAERALDVLRAEYAQAKRDGWGISDKNRFHLDMTGFHAPEN